MEQDRNIELQEELLAEGLNTDENRAGITGLEEQLSADVDNKLQEELAALNDKYLRLAAEFENYKRRTSRERVELLQTAGKEIVSSLLDVLDDTDRASKNLETGDVAQMKEGINLVFSKLRSTLQAKGLKQMEALGSDFDPELHDAITEIPAPGQEGKVVDVVTPGYFLNDKIIRHAKVVVGK
ncbi:MAG: nucleotide exchange factor GrpE [Bacteroidetes bacterium]|nr:nucleotide exchange factor GrpE [Bacteroidota bacterium]MBS1628975.1 nucleotide exchange factor GrpE [Bacteroidota bacterium]